MSDHVLLISTRSLGAPFSGRKAVLRSTVAALTGLGRRVVVAAFGDPDEEGAALAAGAVAVHQLPGPSRGRVVAGLPTRGARTLNELLWWHPKALHELRKLVKEYRPELVVADGLRTAEYARQLGLPWFVDLDDLMSDRYENWASRDLSFGSVLGFRRPQGRLEQAVLDRLPAAKVLRTEARRTDRREREVARTASGVSLVSAGEAARLAERSGRTVHALPMAFEVEARRDWAAYDPQDRRMAYPGSLTYFPNLEAVRWWGEVLEPELRRRGLSGYRLHVYGDVPAAESERLARCPGVVLEGRRPLEVLQAELATYPFLLVPQREAMGLTTKIIESALIGPVVLATRASADGMALTDRVDALLWDDVEELEGQLRWLQGRTAEDLGAMAARARTWARETFSPDAVRERWRTALASLEPTVDTTVGGPTA